MAGHTHFDESTEEYLEAIYRLDREGPGVSTSGIATELGVAPASVSGMLKKLASEGYINYQVRGAVHLTERGLSVAVRIMRRNRLAECFLTQVLGMPWDEVHEEACRLEHAISDRVEARLVAILGDPKFCPHGHPIPPVDLTEPQRNEHKLSEVPVGGIVRILDVAEDVPEMLRYLEEIGILPGAIIEIVGHAPFGGGLTIVAPNGRHAVSLQLARLISVGDADPAHRQAVS
jgi:DtxR family Mn-dependent transcriptional regulator